MKLAASRLLFAIAGLATCGVAAYWSIRIAYADSLSRGEVRDEEQAARALRVAPDDAECHLRMAALLKQNGSNPMPELERAASLNPENYRIWIELALESESGRDYAVAERYLLRAATASRLFEPRWLLANFYFRRGDAPRFWRWARDALLIGSDDPEPLYRLCWRMSGDGAAIGRIIPDQRRLLASYLRFLVAENKLADAQPIAARLLPKVRDDDLPYLLLYCDRLLEARQVPAAVEVWNGMSRLSLVPDRDTLLVNPAFAREPLGHGFDWRLNQVYGVTAYRPATGGLHLQFSGEQPENCDILTQFVPLPEGGKYRLRVDSQATGISPDAGLQWTVTEAYTRAGLARVQLSYHRAPGTTRIEGSLHLRKVELVSAP